MQSQILNKLAFFYTSISNHPQFSIEPIDFPKAEKIFKSISIHTIRDYSIGFSLFPLNLKIYLKNEN